MVIKWFQLECKAYYFQNRDDRVHCHRVYDIIRHLQYGYCTQFDGKYLRIYHEKWRRIPMGDTMELKAATGNV